MSGDPYVTLPNGYKLGSANTYDGFIEAPGFKSDVPTEGPGYVRGIIHLQYSNGYFVGTHFVFPDSKVKTFVYDTRTRGFQSNDGEDAAAWVESVSGVDYEAGSYWDLYSQYRKTWPNRVLLLMIIASEGVLGVWWLRVWIG